MRKAQEDLARAGMLPDGVPLTGLDPVTGEDFSWKLSPSWRRSAELNAQRRRN